ASGAPPAPEREPGGQSGVNVGSGVSVCGGHCVCVGVSVCVCGGQCVCVWGSVCVICKVADSKPAGGGWCGNDIINGSSWCILIGLDHCIGHMSRAGPSESYPQHA